MTKNTTLAEGPGPRLNVLYSGFHFLYIAKHFICLKDRNDLKLKYERQKGTEAPSTLLKVEVALQVWITWPLHWVDSPADPPGCSGVRSITKGFPQAPLEGPSTLKNKLWIYWCCFCVWSQTVWSIPEGHDETISPDLKQVRGQLVFHYRWIWAWWCRRPLCWWITVSALLTLSDVTALAVVLVPFQCRKWVYVSLSAFRPP